MSDKRKRITKVVDGKKLVQYEGDVFWTVAK